MTATVELSAGFASARKNTPDTPGCPNCAFGIRHDSPPVDLALPSYLSRLMQWRLAPSSSATAGWAAGSPWANAWRRTSRRMTTACALMQQRRERRIAAMFANAQVPPKIPPSDIQSYVEIAGAERGRKPALDAVREFTEFGQSNQNRG